MTSHEPEILVIKHSAYMEVPDELLMDMDIIPDTRPPAPKQSLRVRWFWWKDRNRERLARWAYRRISGYDVPESDD